MKLSLVILTKNEIGGVKEVVPRIDRASVDEIFAVDGGSTDGTREAFAEMGITVVPQTSPGRGEAFRIAVERAAGDALIFFSPDGNEDPKDIAKFRAYLEAGADMVIASRMMRGAHNEEDDLWLPVRKWVNQAFTLIINLLWNRSGRYVTDTINGFRAIRKEVFRDLAPDGSGYTIEFQSSIRAFKKRKKIIEFPTHESARIGPGGSPGLKTGIAFIKCLFREIGLSLGLKS
jgi:glycosyltransferase involved in cell wall biosynthesis